jgi:MFS transporter, DHA1 family, multidrug resistance protein
MAHRPLIAFCAVLLALNAFSCEMLLPAFFALEERYATDRASIQALIPIYLMAAAIGQMVFGPLSDRYGRKPVLLAGVLIYMVACIAAIFAPSLSFMYAARMLQGFGAACMVVIGRAILRDTHNGIELARAMALAMAIFTIGPLTGPLIGALLFSFAGWQGPFVGLFCLGLGLLGYILLRFRETIAVLDSRALEPARLASAMKRIVTHPQSRRFLFVLTLTQVIIILFISNAAQIFKARFGIDGLAFAQLFALAATGIVLGQYISNRLLARAGILLVLRGATAFSLLTAIATLLLASHMGVTLFVILLFMFHTAFLVVVANAVSLVLDPHKDIAGTASATLGCVSQLTGSLVALLVLRLIDGSVGQWALCHAGLNLLAAAVVWTHRPVASVEATGAA